MSASETHPRLLMWSEFRTRSFITYRLLHCLSAGCQYVAFLGIMRPCVRVTTPSSFFWCRLGPSAPFSSPQQNLKVDGAACWTAAGREDSFSKQSRSCSATPNHTHTVSKYTHTVSKYTHSKDTHTHVAFSLFFFIMTDLSFWFKFQDSLKIHCFLQINQY